MENVLFEAGCEKWINKPGFNGLKIFKIEDDVLYLDFFDGRKFSSPINDLQVRRTTGWRLLLQPALGRLYELTTSDGKVLKIGGLYTYKDFMGFFANVTGAKSLLKADEKVWEIYGVLDSLPNTKKSGLEIFELILSWGFIAFIVLGIILANALG